MTHLPAAASCGCRNGARLDPKDHVREVHTPAAEAKQLLHRELLYSNRRSSTIQHVIHAHQRRRDRARALPLQLYHRSRPFERVVAPARPLPCLPPRCPASGIRTQATSHRTTHSRRDRDDRFRMAFGRTSTGSVQEVGTGMPPMPSFGLAPFYYLLA